MRPLGRTITGRRTGAQYKPLLQVLANRFGYEDKDIINDIPVEAPTLRGIPTRPPLTSREKAVPDTAENFGGISSRNKSPADRVQEFRHAEIGAECFDKSPRLAQSSWLSTHVPLTGQIAKGANVTPPCYAIEAPNGGGRGKSESLATWNCRAQILSPRCATHRRRTSLTPF